MEILFFFYFFRVTVSSQSGRNFSDSIEDICASIFNFKVDGESYEIRWCPVEGLDGIGKSLSKAAFIGHVAAPVILLKDLAVMIRKCMRYLGYKSPSERGKRFEV